MWDASSDAAAKVMPEAHSAAPDDTFTGVVHGERAVGRVMLIDGKWHWSLRAGGSGYAATRAKALAALAKAWGANGGVERRALRRGGGGEGVRAQRAAALAARGELAE